MKDPGIKTGRLVGDLCSSGNWCMYKFPVCSSRNDEQRNGNAGALAHGPGWRLGNAAVDWQPLHHASCRRFLQLQEHDGRTHGEQVQQCSWYQVHAAATADGYGYDGSFEFLVESLMWIQMKQHVFMCVFLSRLQWDEHGDGAVQSAAVSRQSVTFLARQYDGNGQQVVYPSEHHDYKCAV